MIAADCAAMAYHSEESAARHAQAKRELDGLRHFVETLDVSPEQRLGKQFLLAMCSLHERGFPRMRPGRNLEIVESFFGQHLPAVLRRYEDSMRKRGTLMRLSPLEQEAILSAWEMAVDQLNREHSLSTGNVGCGAGPDVIARETVLGSEYHTLCRRDAILKGLSALSVGALLVHDMDNINKQPLPPREKERKALAHAAMHGGGFVLGHFLVDTFTRHALAKLEDSDHMRDGMLALIGALTELAPQFVAEAQHQAQTR